MTLPKASFTAEARIQKNRSKKAERFVQHFLAKMAESVENPEYDKSALTTALEIVRSATVDQWERCAKELTEENRKAGLNRKEESPSGATFTLIVEKLEALIATIEERRSANACRGCGGVRDDPTDRLCNRCQAKELMEGNNAERVAHGEAPRWA